MYQNTVVVVKSLYYIQCLLFKASRLLSWFFNEYSLQLVYYIIIMLYFERINKPTKFFPFLHHQKKKEADL